MNQKAFSIIEVIMATFILSISVFGVYKLISENVKIIGKSEDNLQAYTLLQVANSCIDSKKNTISGTNYYLDIGKDYKKCNLLTNEKLINIDGKNYSIHIKTNDNTKNIIFWKISVSNDSIGTISNTYIQKK